MAFVLRYFFSKFRRNGNDPFQAFALVLTREKLALGLCAAWCLCACPENHDMSTSL
jgi:hypothetical protein